LKKPRYRNAAQKWMAQIILPGMAGFPLPEVLSAFSLQLKKTNLSERAASISFSFLMAIPAATIFLLTLIPLTPLADSIQQQMQNFISDIAPNENTARLIARFQGFLDENLNKTRIGLLSFGFLWMIFSASNAMMGVIRTFDRSVVEIKKSNFLVKRWRAIKLTVVILFLLIGTFLILAGQNWLFDHLMEWMNITNTELIWWIKSLRWLFIIGLFIVSIGTIYKYAPSQKKRGPLISAGAIFSTVLVLMLTWLFSLWVNNFVTVNSLYGSIGSVIIMMSLIFFNSLVLLLGYELNVAIDQLKYQKRKAA